MAYSDVPLQIALHDRKRGTSKQIYRHTPTPILSQPQVYVIRVIKVFDGRGLPKIATRPSAALANAIVSTPGEVGTSLKD